MPQSRHRRLCTAAVVLAAAIGPTACRRGDPERLPGVPAATEGTANRAEAHQVRFADITAETQVNAIYRNGEESDNFSFVESLGGGVGVLDYNLSGRQDLFFAGGGEIVENEPLKGRPGSLWQALDDGTFEDVTAAAGLAHADLYTHGVAVADIDGDGFPDLLVTGYGGVQLFRNCGDGTFVETAAAAGIDSQAWISSAAFGDLDGDGLVDLYLVSYVDWSWSNHPLCPGIPPRGRDVCTPERFDGLTDSIYWNQGDGTFVAADESAGLVEGGKGLGVILLDVDHDSRLDIYVANDTTDNFLYMNRGDRRFQESGIISGTALDHHGIPNGSMGITAFDYDGSLLPDLFVTNFENETFAVYRNSGEGHFRSVSERSGITALGTLLVGFGVVAADFNLNGFEDLVIANGHVLRYPLKDNLRQFPLYISNDGRGRLTRLQFPDDSFFATRRLGRGVVAADLNGNGRPDLVFTHTNEPAAVLENRTAGEGGWLGLKLIGRRANRDAIGARAVLETRDGKQILRHVYGGGSYLSQGPYSLHWGVPEGDVPSAVEIVWPDGERQRIDDLSPNRVLTVVQPAGE